MKKFLCGVAVAAMAAMPLAADPVDEPLVINGDEELAIRAPTPAHLEGVFPEIMSGWLFRDESTRAMQMDDFDNPGMIFADEGMDLWNAVEGSEGKSCASCHQDIGSMAGVRAAMPRMNGAGDDLWSLENFINACRTGRMGAEAWGWNSAPMTAMTSAISLQSRGMPVDVATDGPAQTWWDRGKEIYYTRFGQLEMSCASCHEQNWGRYIRADHLSQGQTNGFPVYRLKQAGIVSIHNRFKGCIRDTRGETFKEGSPELRALELYVASRGEGLAVEGVSVRH